MLDFIFGEESGVINNPQYSPLTTAFMIVESAKGFLLLYNKYLKLWELTGGMIEAGETPKACAIRECREECNQEISDPHFVGLAKMFYKKNRYREQDMIAYSAVYHAFLQGEQEFLENDEIADICWWKPDEEKDGVCAASIEMIRRYLRAKETVKPDDATCVGR